MDKHDERAGELIELYFGKKEAYKRQILRDNIAAALREVAQETHLEIAARQLAIHGESVCLNGRVVTNEELYKQPTDYIKEARAAAKAEIERVKEVLDKSIALNAPLVSENKRLREEIEERGHAFQKVSNENLLEIKRLREALEICHPLAIQEKHAAYRGACGACAALDGGKA